MGNMLITEVAMGGPSPLEGAWCALYKMELLSSWASSGRTKRRTTMQIKGWPNRTQEQRLNSPGIILPREEKAGEGQGGHNGRGALKS